MADDCRRNQTSSGQGEGEGEEERREGKKAGDQRQFRGKCEAEKREEEGAPRETRVSLSQLSLWQKLLQDCLPVCSPLRPV